jgi:deoxycytidylate deaminase
MGCNEVPKAGGGTYWSGGPNDYRDYALGYDSNQKVREDMTRDALVRLQQKGWLSKKVADLKPDELVAEAFALNEEGGPLSQSMISDVIEFGRMVHAEMNALADAARFRRSTVGSTLYCTTLPCHMCAKLIIAAGIERVVYVQPYNKSLIEELFSDSVSIGERPAEKKVIFDSLKGVTPNGFKLAFQKTRKRKDAQGNAIKWDPTSAHPVFLSIFPYYQSLEKRALGDLGLALGKVIRARSMPTDDSTGSQTAPMTPA